MTDRYQPILEGLDELLSDQSLDPNDHRALLTAYYFIKDVARKKRGISARHDVTNSNN